MSFCPILMAGNDDLSPRADFVQCRGPQCEWFERGCPAHPRRTAIEVEHITPAKPSLIPGSGGPEGPGVIRRVMTWLRSI